ERAIALHMRLSRNKQTHPAQPSLPPLSAPVSPWLHWWILLTALATLLLVGAGGLVTSHGVGMAVPDWPNTYGYNMFFFPFSRWVGGIFYEHTHRLLASFVGLMTAITAVWMFGRKARPFLRWTGVALLVLAGVARATAPARWSDALVSALTGAAALAASFAWPRAKAAPTWLRRLGVLAFLAVVLQGVLGGLRVILLRDQIGVFHAALAQLFFALMCSLALFTSGWWARTAQAHGVQDAAPAANLSWRWLFPITTLLILAQLVLGAAMRHQHAGLAIPDFPLAYGRLWPATDPAAVAMYNQHRLEVVSLNAITGSQIVLQMVHRLVAVAVLATVGACAWSTRRETGRSQQARQLARLWLGLILIQVSLGAWTVWSNKAADIATAHVVGGALSLAVGVLATVVSFRGLPLLIRTPARVFVPAAARPGSSPAGAPMLPSPRPAQAATS
ncbi:MAG TPA: COX15/CtaA family protein, partial [Verrucomicrobiae bacterium]